MKQPPSAETSSGLPPPVLAFTCATIGTDLPWNWRNIVEVFKLRMSIEELFRDEKPEVRPCREYQVRLG